MKKTFVIDARTVRREIIGPREYLDLVDKKPTVIEKAEFVPPRPGHSGFGGFRVTYVHPRLKTGTHG